jgi:hypothetical protein
MSRKFIFRKNFLLIFGFFLIVLLFSCKVGDDPDSTGNSSTPPQGERLTWQFSVSQLREDFVQLRNTLENNHPDRLRYETAGELNHLFNAAYDSLQAPMTELVFYQVVAPLVARYHCGHTMVFPSTSLGSELAQRGLVLPLSIYRTGDKVFVDADYNSGSGIVLGSEILTINGVEIGQIYNRIMSGMSADAMNTTKKIRQLNREFALYYYYFWGEETQFDIVLKVPGSNVETTVTVIPRIYAQVYQEAAARFSSDVQLRFEINGTRAVLTVPSFDISNNPNFRVFFNDVFTQFRDRGVENLIIDVRGNSGGDPEMSVDLISYLADEPFVYFKSGLGYNHLFTEIQPHQLQFTGKVYVLIDGGCFSTTGHFCSIVRYMGLGTFIGNTGGGTYRCHDNSTRLNLRHTGIFLRVARTTYETAVPDHNVSDGFIPDFTVVPTVDDMIGGNDPQMLYVLQLIDESTNN